MPLFHRRAAPLLILLAIAVATPAGAAHTTATPPQGPTIGETSGDGAIAIFRGIPFATPPVGARRWTRAEPAPDWKAPRLATRYSPTCMQVSMPETIKLGDGSKAKPLFWQPGQQASEDCLYLNVWTPEPALSGKGKPLPVMVWIHGGAFMNGSGTWPQFDGEALARKGVVLVTINYRLGIFGFFNHPELAAESPRGSSGNYGLSDQIAALKWVKRNIGAFGGDPGNVTIFGESAGSFSVSLLLANRQAEGLFQKAIGQSGAYFHSMLAAKRPSFGWKSAEDYGTLFADLAAPGKGLSGLRTLPAAELEAKAEAFRAIDPSRFIVVDGDIYKRQVRDIFAAGEQIAVPVLVGFNSDEGSGLADYGAVAPPPSSPETYRREVRTRFGDLASRWLRQYPASDPVAAMFDAYRDSMFGWTMEAWAEATEKVSKPAYFYYFSRRSRLGEVQRAMPNSPATRRIGAHHGAEIPYIFGRAGQPGDADAAVSDTMADYWVAFAQSGDPNGFGRPPWRPYTTKARHFMHFGATIEPGIDLLPGALALHAEIYRRRAAAGLPTGFGESGFAARLPQPKGR